MQHAELSQSWDGCNRYRSCTHGGGVEYEREPCKLDTCDCVVLVRHFDLLVHSNRFSAARHSTLSVDDGRRWIRGTHPILQSMDESA